MTRSKVWLILGFVGSLSAPLVHAEETAGSDDTVVAGTSDTPDQVVNAMSLPDSASDAAREHAAFGQNVASQARDQASTMGRDFGQQVAADARDLGAQMRDDMQANQHASAGAANAGSHGRP